MTKTRLSLVLPLLTAACGNSSSPPSPPANELRSDKVRVTAPSVSAEDAAALANDNLAFAVDMHLALRSTAPGNFIFSQTSISTALAMLYAGAATTTAAEMADALRFGLPAERLHPGFNALDLALTTPPAGSSAAAFRLSVANSLWVQDGFAVLPSYLDTLAQNYGAGLFVEDFVGNAEGARDDDQRLGLRSHRGADPRAVPRRLNQWAHAAGAGQRRLLPRRLEDALRAQQPERDLPRARAATSASRPCTARTTRRCGAAQAGAPPRSTTSATPRR